MDMVTELKYPTVTESGTALAWLADYLLNSTCLFGAADI